MSTTRTLWFMLIVIAAGCRGKTTEPMEQLAELARNEGPMPPALEQPPIFQDRDQIQRDRAARLNWYRSTMLDPYKEIGSRDSKWDDAAFDAIEKLAKLKSVGDRDKEALESAIDALERAVALGCDDPLIRYFHLSCIRLLPEPQFSPDELRKRTVVTSRALMESRYPAIRRAHATYNYSLTLAAKADTKNQAGEFYAKSLKLFRESLRDGSRFAKDDFVKFAELFMDFRARLGERQTAYDEIMAELGNDAELKSVRARVHAKHLLRSAWEIRGGKFANDVPAANMNRFQAKLVDAEAAFEEAWRLDSTATDVAIGMISIRGTIGDYQGIEEWFGKAMKADGDCVEACRTKLNFLKPQWGGHTDAMRQFCKRMVETKNWEAGMGAKAIDTYAELAITYHGKEGVLDKDWPSVREHVETWAKDRPGSKWPWTRYAMLGDQSQKADVVLEAEEHLQGKSLRTVCPQSRYASFKNNVHVYQK